MRFVSAVAVVVVVGEDILVVDTAMCCWVDLNVPACIHQVQEEEVDDTVAWEEEPFQAVVRSKETPWRNKVIKMSFARRPLRWS